MTARKGIMLYFEMRSVLMTLPPRDAIMLVYAMLDYGEFGEEPDFKDRLPLIIAWSLIKPRIDRDGAAYEEKCMKSRYAAYCREHQKTGTEADLKSYDEWRNAQSDDIG